MATDARPRINPTALSPEIAAAAAAISRKWDERTRQKRLRADWKPQPWQVPTASVDDVPQPTDEEESRG